MGLSLIAANTKRIIADKGLKQRAVAAKAGFSEKQFSALMTGRKIIRHLAKIRCSGKIGA
jgi:DNA-binding Xre family transcriptional regulator